MLFDTSTRILLVAALLNAPQGYWAFRFWRAVGGESAARRRLRWAGIAVLLVLQVPSFLLFFGRTTLLDPLTSGALGPLRLLSATWAMGALSAFAVVVGLRCVGALARLGSRRRAAEGAVDPDRRRLLELTSSGLVAMPWIIVARGAQSARMDHRVERVSVAMPDLPELLDGFRIVQLTDVHVSEDMPPALIEHFVEVANGLGADLGVLTGDFLALDQWGLEECVRQLSQLETPAGILGCLGNHEIHCEAEDLITAAFERRGVDILRDEARDLEWKGERLRVVGVDYQRSKRAPLWHVRRLVSPDAPNLLLSHNPNVFPHAAELGIDLTVAGHTHGGQVRVEILEREISPARFMTPFVKGLYRQGASQLYVSRGIGTTGLPIRLGAPPEVTEITLRRAVRATPSRRSTVPSHLGIGLSSESHP